jgi:crotonobetainyl-CoA:carnitine CoA-transferase CaiB-like acyl-CoA transferase
MRAIGRPDLAEDPALATNEGRVAQDTFIDETISAWASQRSIDEVLSALEAADVPAGRIYSVADIVHDPHFLDREMILQAHLPGGTDVKMPGIVPKLSETPGEVRWQGPKLGEHTDAILGELGYDQTAIADLRAKGAVA